MEPDHDEQHRPHGHEGHSHLREAGEVVADAALRAERSVGRVEETDAQARRGVIIRLVRAGGGFMLVGVGLALLPLPGPGWLVIILGLSLLPFRWAEQTILAIRRRIPGIPDDGNIPTRTWVVMGLMIGASTVISILFGARIGAWLGDVWENLWG